MDAVSHALDAARLWAALASASFRAQLQYRASVAVRTLVDTAVLFSDFLPIWFLLQHFGALGTWAPAEVALLYGMVELSWAPAEGALRGFENFSVYLLRGDLDRWLLRPRGIALQVGASEVDVRKAGRALQGALVLVAAAWWVGAGPASLAWIALGVAGGVLFFAGVVMLGAASLFWTLGQTTELQNILTYGGTAALSYPVSVYGRWFRRVVTYAVPLAFVNYFPALAALGKVDAEGWPAFVPWLSPLVCAAVLACGLAAFRRGLSRYESTGS
jgi:ABC-2 type transport system permease protein